MPDTPTNGKHDVWTHRIAVAAVSLTIVGDIIAITLLAVDGKDIPPTLPAVGFTALAALTSMLNRIMTGSQDQVALPKS